MSSFDLVPLLKSAFEKEYILCPITGHEDTTLNTRRIFSFSLFINEANQAIKRKLDAGEPVSKEELATINGWQYKYLFNQVNKFDELLKNPTWRDFGIVWFVEGKVMDLFGAEIEASGYIRVNHPERIILLRYDECTPSLFYGTIVRYYPLVTGGFEVVLFRDAHSTMPNPNNRYDRNWFDTWLKTDKRFWLYQGIFYNPAHADGRKAPFAAAWGVRGDPRSPLIPSDAWNEYFGNFARDPKGGAYGIDERIFADLIENVPVFLRDSYIVGITWLLYIFVPYANPRTFTETKDKIWFCKERGGHHSVFIYTYFTEARCVVYYIAKVYGTGLNTPIGELWKEIDRLQVMLPDVSKPEKVLLQLVNMVPSRAHLWDFLFDVGNIVNEDTSLINAITWFGVSEFDYQNMCNILPKYLRGGEYNYDKYIDILEKDIEGKTIHHPLPRRDIKLPADYPQIQRTIRKRRQR